MSEGGAALMAVGEASGEDRAKVAAEKAISSQLLDVTINGAHGILFNVTGSSNLSLFEVNQAASIIKETASPDVNLIFGAVIDESMGDKVRITVIATGFDHNHSPNEAEASAFFPGAASSKTDQRVDLSDANRLHETGQKQAQPQRNESYNYATMDEDIDVPTFIRKRRDLQTNRDY
jgi:cell division protein FtsZ